MGFVRVSGYNENDIANAISAAKNGWIEGLGPDYFGVKEIYTSGQTGSYPNWTMKYYPSNTEYTEAETIVSYNWFYCEGPNEWENDASLQIHGFVENVSSDWVLLSDNYWTHLAEGKGDSSFGLTPSGWGTIILPAHSRLRIRYKAKQNAGSVTLCAGIYIYKIYGDTSSEDDSSSDVTNGTSGTGNNGDGNSDPVNDDPNTELAP